MGQRDTPIGGSRPTDQRILALELENKRATALINERKQEIDNLTVAGRKLIYNETLAADGQFDTGAVLDQSYSRLTLELVGRSTYDNSYFQTYMMFYFNGDNNVFDNYYGEYLGTGSTEVNFPLFPLTPAPVAASMWGVAKMEIPFYADTAKTKIAYGEYAMPANHAPGTGPTDIYFIRGINALKWSNTAAINRIATFTDGGQLKAGSRLRIWGWVE